MRCPSNKQTSRKGDSPLQWDVGDETTEAAKPLSLVLTAGGNNPNDRWSLILLPLFLINKLVSVLMQRAVCLVFFFFLWSILLFSDLSDSNWEEISDIVKNNVIFFLSSIGCSPTTPTASPPVLRRWSCIFAGCRTETLPQHKRPKWETKTHSVSNKNSPTWKYAVFWNVQWNVTSGLCTDGPKP